MKKILLSLLLISSLIFIGCGHNKVTDEYRENIDDMIIEESIVGFEYIGYEKINNKKWVGYTENIEYEFVDITPVHKGYNIIVNGKKGPEFSNEEECLKRVNDSGNRDKSKTRKACYNTDPNNRIGFYMGDSEPRPVFKTFEKCEDWAISMMPHSLLKNAKSGIHAGDGDTRCSQGCHYTRRGLSCDKTIHSVIGWDNKFEKIMDKLDKGRNYERFIDAFGNDLIGCDIVIKNKKKTYYSYLFGIGHEIGISSAAMNTHKYDKVTTRQKNIKNGKTFYIQQMDGLLYIWGEIYNNGIGKIYKIKNTNDEAIFKNIKNLFDNCNIEINCHNDFGGSTNTLKDFFALPEDIERIDAGEIDDIYYRIYQKSL